MIFPDADTAAMLAALGETAMTPAGAITVLFEAPVRAMDAGHGSVYMTAPAAVAADDAIAALSLSGGAGGSSMTIREIEYVITSITSDGDGFSTMTLERA